MLVADIMTRGAHVIDASASLARAARAMARHGVGFLPVRRGGRLVGVVTDRDLALRPAVARRSYDEACVADVLSTEAHAIREDTSLEAAAGALRATGVRRLLVLDAAGTLVGVLSLGDLAACERPPGLVGAVLRGRRRACTGAAR